MRKYIKYDNEKQKTTLERLANHHCIRLNYECYSEEKIDYFLSLLGEINLQKNNEQN